MGRLEMWRVTRLLPGHLASSHPHLLLVSSGVVNRPSACLNVSCLVSGILCHCPACHLYNHENHDDHDGLSSALAVCFIRHGKSSVCLSGLVSLYLVWYLLSYICHCPACHLHSGLTWFPISQKWQILPGHLASHLHSAAPCLFIRHLKSSVCLSLLVS